MIASMLRASGIRSSSSIAFNAPTCRSLNAQPRGIERIACGFEFDQRPEATQPGTGIALHSEDIAPHRIEDRQLCFGEIQKGSQRGPRPTGEAVVGEDWPRWIRPDHTSANGLIGDQRQRTSALDPWELFPLFRRHQRAILRPHGPDIGHQLAPQHLDFHEAGSESQGRLILRYQH